MLAAHTLPKEERLHGKRAMDGLFADAHNTFFCQPYQIFWQQVVALDTCPVQFAISVPKRRMKLAVKRNLIKRRTREAYRLNKHILTITVPKDKQIRFMLVYLTGEIHSFATIDNAMKTILQKIAKENAKSN